MYISLSPPPATHSSYGFSEVKVVLAQPHQLGKLSPYKYAEVCIAPCHATEQKSRRAAKERDRRAAEPPASQQARRDSDAAATRTRRQALRLMPHIRTPLPLPAMQPSRPGLRPRKRLCALRNRRHLVRLGGGSSQLQPRCVGRRIPCNPASMPRGKHASGALSSVC